MKRFLLLIFASIISTFGLSACNGTAGKDPGPVITPSHKTMKAFASDDELKQYLKQLAEKQKQLLFQRGVANKSDADVPPAKGDAFSLDESVTNTQEVGVDEGGIVKAHGNHLVILRRGRLFTVAIGDNTLTAVSHINAFSPDIDPERTWYDEMLVSRDSVVVIGYSYERGGTEVGLFNIDAEGQLSYRSTYQVRSFDYYSSRNYASRLIGSKLIFYSPLYFYPSADKPLPQFPSVRKWRKGINGEEEFQRIAPATRIYRPEGEIESNYGMALHTVTVCDLANGGFDCQATSVVGPPSRTFYVSPDSIYVWASSWNYDDQRSKATLFRLPLDGSGPSALRVSGSPVDQFSFSQSADQNLNVLVRSQAKGDGMWAAEVAQGDVALMRIPIASFSDGSDKVPATSYQQLPKPEGYTFQNRFVGNYLLYGTGSGWGPPEQLKEPKDLFLVEWAARGNAHKIELPHGVDRIEQMGKDAVVVGTDGKDLHFTAIRLGPQPEIASRYTRAGASQGELRSHGFFYKPESDNDGTIGLPISVPGRAGYHHLFESSAAILFLRNESLQFRPVGELSANAEKAIDDNCRASCVDWYGNARPLFLRGRLFALLGYELVEGKLDNGQIHELRRINYAP
jgi:hypothetical protein